MRAALLLVDLQQDFLQRTDLWPVATTVVNAAAVLLDRMRQLDLPILHVHTVVSPDGSNRMPHWQRNETWACVEGTPGALSPDRVAPRGTEAVFSKSFFTAFENTDLLPTLRQLGVEVIIVAGVYTHGCIRSTVLDAYQAGFEVWMADDAVASYDPVHAELTRQYLNGRACQFLDVHQIVQRLGTGPPPLEISPKADVLPVGWVNDAWLPAKDHHRYVRRSPIDWSVCLASVPFGSSEDVKQAILAATRCQTRWQTQKWCERAERLQAFSQILIRRAAEFTSLLMSEVGKPHAEAAGELDYALSLIASATQVEPNRRWQQGSNSVSVRHSPLGTVAIVTPWNNPLAIPVGKIAPALVWGNTVVWKAAVESPRLAMLLMETLNEAGLPPGCVNMVFGGAATVQSMLRDPHIAAVSFTGSSRSGQQVAAICAVYGKKLQAELGGNNAAVVITGCDIEAVAQDVANAAFSFAGQRCTAVRRVIVDRAICEPFTEALVEAIRTLPLGLPTDHSTRIGPLVSRPAQERIAKIVGLAREQDGTVHSGGQIPVGFGHGCWYEPTLISGLDHQSPVVQTESFGPVLIRSDFADIEDALRQLNAVEQGLTATCYSNDLDMQRAFVESAEAGVIWLQGRPAALDPRAPFGGWKESGIGPPEHGEWDRIFYTRPQAVYRRGPELER